ncbi:MAG: SRPBCC family protein [Pseudomonadales bacterium]|nr:SRPBCC family protein [Pseudomonadales bacterium]
MTYTSVANAAEWKVEEFKIDEDKLRDHEIQTFEKTFKDPDQKEGETKGIMGVLLIDAPYDVVWEVISDWEKQGEFVPGLEYFKVKYIFPNGSPLQWHSLVEGQLDIPFVSFRYTLDAVFNKDEGTMIWNMLTPEDITGYQSQKVDVRASDEERLKNIEGFGKIKSYNDIQTIYYYAPIVEVSVPIPGFVEDIISRVSLSRYLEAIKNRAEEVHQRARIESPKRVADSVDEIEFE